MAETRNRYNGLALSITEVNALEVLEGLLRANGSLQEGEAIPFALKDKLDIRDSRVGFYAENHSVVALSVRYCALTALPDSLGQLTNLRQLDVTGNQLTSFPESLGNLIQLKKLYVDENQLTALPESLENLVHLEEMHVDENRLVSLPENIGQLT
ncbi:MAG: hypothetical protein ABI406_09430, partial [Ktedonobacteraceae bacterium]